jgi:hypothetical protein
MNDDHNESLPSHLLLAGCLLAVLFAAGCRRQGPEIVTGTITWGGGSWPKPGALYFTVESPAPGQPTRPATAKFDVDGNITVKTFAEGDGLIPGKYKIAVECWDVPPRMGSPTPPKSHVPARYSSPATSGLTVDVQPGQNGIALKLDVPKE